MATSPTLDLGPLRLAVVVTDPARSDIGCGLRSSGFEVAVVPWTVAVLDDVASASPHVVVTDLDVRGGACVDACRALRSAFDLPIVVVGDPEDETEVVLALEVGADDLVRRGCGLRELGARLRAVHRRSAVRDGAHRSGPVDLGAAASPDPAPIPSEVVHVGDLRLDRSRHEAFVGGTAVHLSPKEFDLLWVLAANAGSLVPRSALIEQVWGADHVGGTKTLDVHVRRLRGRLEDDPANPRRITTIRGVGFLYDPVAVPAERTAFRVVG